MTPKNILRFHSLIHTLSNIILKYLSHGTRTEREELQITDRTQEREREIEREREREREREEREERER